MTPEAQFSRHSSARVGRILSRFLLLAGVVVNLNAETTTFQLPLSRADHLFSIHVRSLEDPAIFERSPLTLDISSLIVNGAGQVQPAP